MENKIIQNSNNNSNNNNNLIKTEKKIIQPGIISQNSWKLIDEQVSQKFQYPTRGSTFFERMKDFVTNQRYNFNQLSSYTLSVTPEHPILILLGQTYIYPMNPLQLFQNLVWFSYRKNFPILQPEFKNEDNYISDRGWGCMLRVGQMMLSTVLQILNMDEMEILQLFNDFESSEQKSPFSIQNICKVTWELFKTKPGEWYKPTIIAFCFQHLLNKPVLEKVNIWVEVVTDGCLFIQELYYHACGREKVCSKCAELEEIELSVQLLQLKEIVTDEQIKLIQQYYEVNHEALISPIGDIFKLLQQQKQKLINCCKQCQNWKDSVWIVFCLRMGVDKINEDYFSHIKYLLDCPFSVGIMGGKPKEALYFVGYQEDKLIYMDPHYVQDAFEFIQSGNLSNNQKIIQSFHQQEMHGIAFHKIDSSLAFGFYVKNEEEFQVLYKYLLLGNFVFENWAIGLQNKFEDDDQNYFPVQQNNNNLKDSEEFEILK